MNIITFLLLILVSLSNCFKVRFTHYHDCNGESCLANSIRPWDYEKYVFNVDHIPKKINDTHMKMTAAFSNDFDIDCFECISFTQNDYTIIIEKTNICPECHGLWIDIDVPGFDNNHFSLANVCSLKQNTYFTNQEQSFLFGEWYLHFNSSQEIADYCYLLPEIFVDSCLLFSALDFKNNQIYLDVVLSKCF